MNDLISFLNSWDAIKVNKLCSLSPPSSKRQWRLMLINLLMNPSSFSIVDECVVVVFSLPLHFLQTTKLVLSQGLTRCFSWTAALWTFAEPPTTNGAGISMNHIQCDRDKERRKQDVEVLRAAVSRLETKTN